MLKFAVGSALLVTATHSVALSLGGTQGSVIIGRPLDILVQSSMDADDAASGLCLEAEVLYGDARVPASAITAAIHRAGSDGALRVRVSQPVNEPIVTVILKAGCQQNFKRSYSLLADFEPLPPPVSTVQPARPTQAAPQPVRPQAATPSRAVPVAPAATGSAQGSRPAPAVEAPQDETPIRLSAPVSRPAGVVSFKTKSRPVAAPVPADVSAGKVEQAPTAAAKPAATEAPEPGGARLKLDPVDVATAQTGAVLQSGNPDAAQAAAVQPGAQSGDVSGAGTDAGVDAAKAVQQELQTLRQEQERLRVSMETMNAQLAQARQEQYSNPVVYGLGALVALLLGGVLWLVRGRKRAEAAVEAAGAAPWWTVSVPAPDSVLPQAPGASAPKLGEPVVSVAPAHEVQGGVEGIEVEEAGASRFQEVPIAKVDIGVLLDLWQQVDFFESIGQQVDAAQALESFVQANPRASEAPYLRWMQLAAQLGIPGMFDRAQAVYEHHYQRLIPGSITSGGAGLGLEDDTGFAQRLTKAWPSDEARAMVEQALVSQPGDASAGLQVRSVHAFDDLMALRGLWDVLQVQTAEREAEPAPMPFHESGWATLDQVDIEAKPASVQAAPDAVAPQEAAKPDLAPLDFDFLDFDKPQKKDGEGSAKP